MKDLSKQNPVIGNPTGFPASKPSFPGTPGAVPAKPIRQPKRQGKDTVC